MLAYAENGSREFLHPYLRLNSALIAIVRNKIKKTIMNMLLMLLLLMMM